MDDADPVKKAQNMQVAIQTCLNKPQWRLSVQTHKVIGMP
jgi:organic radical activating enzyme